MSAEAKTERPWKTVTITITDDTVWSDFPNVEWPYLDGDAERAVHNVRGSCLHALGDTNTIPAQVVVEFKTVDKRTEGKGRP